MSDELYEIDPRIVMDLMYILRKFPLVRSERQRDEFEDMMLDIADVLYDNRMRDEGEMNE